MILTYIKAENTHVTVLHCLLQLSETKSEKSMIKRWEQTSLLNLEIIKETANILCTDKIDENILNSVTIIVFVCVFFLIWQRISTLLLVQYSYVTFSTQ